jgi:hypothetical protein
LEVWQNLAIFGSSSIGNAVEALLTKVINPQLSVLQNLVFCCPPPCRALAVAVPIISVLAYMGGHTRDWSAH